MTNSVFLICCGIFILIYLSSLFLLPMLLKLMISLVCFSFNLKFELRTGMSNLIKEWFFFSVNTFWLWIHQMLVFFYNKNQYFLIIKSSMFHSFYLSHVFKFLFDISFCIHFPLITVV